MNVTTPARYEFVDFAKGYAILTIILFHTLQRVGLSGLSARLIIFGGSGVHLFFLLSGFGLGLSRAVLSPLQFYQRRLTKIWVPYILALTLSLIAALVFNLFPDRWTAWFAGVGLYQMFSPTQIESFGGHFWFISTIIQFYIFFPVYRQLEDRKRPSLWLAVYLLLSIGWWLIVFIFDKSDYRNWNSCFLQFSWEFALGMAIAGALTSKYLNIDLFTRLVHLMQRYWQPRLWWLWLCIGLFFCMLMFSMILIWGNIGRIFNDIPALLGYSGLCIGVYLFSLHYWLRLKQFFLWVSDFSFSLYLIHILVLESLIFILHAAGLSFNLAWLPLYFVLAILGGKAFEALSKRVIRLL